MANLISWHIYVRYRIYEILIKIKIKAPRHVHKLGFFFVVFKYEYLNS